MEVTLKLASADELRLLKRCMELAESRAWSDAGFIIKDGGEHKRIARKVSRLRAKVDKLEAPL